MDRAKNQSEERGKIGEAPDGHAKNFSIKLLAGGRYQLTPQYDVMSIWPIECGGANQYALHKAKLAMALLGKNNHYRFADVQRRHFNSTAARCFLRTDAEDVTSGCWRAWLGQSMRWRRVCLPDSRSGWRT